MAVKRSIQQNNYGWPAPYADNAPKPVVTNVNPTVNDEGKEGQVWINKTAATAFIHVGVINGQNQWAVNPTGALAVASMIINPGSLDVQVGDITGAGALTITGLSSVGSLVVGTTAQVTTDLSVGGNTLLAGNLGVVGDVSITGDFDLTNPAQITLTSTDNAAGAITLLANGGAAETLLIQSAQGTGVGSVGLVSTAGGITLQAGKATATAINLTNSNAAGGMTITSGTAGVIGNSTGAIVLTSTKNAAGSIELQANGGVTESIELISQQGTAAGAIALTAAAGGIIVSAQTDMTIAATTGTIGLTSVGATTINSGVGAMSISSDASATTVHVATGAGVKTTVLGSINTTSGTTVQSGTTGISIAATNGIVSMQSGTAATNINTAATANVTTIGNATGTSSVIINGGTGNMQFGANAIAHSTMIGSATGAATTTIQGGTGGIALTAGGHIFGDYVTDTQASPTAATANAANIGRAIFTGFTTAAAASQVFTVTNANVTTSSLILVTASNLGAADAKMTVTRVTPAAGSFTVTLTNNGAAALNGNCQLSWWIINY